MTQTQNWRWPAEWEPQDAIILAWPHAQTDWAANLDAVQECYVALIAAICRFQRVLLIVPDAATQSQVQARLQTAYVPSAAVHWVLAPYDDTWLRDSGPVTLQDGQHFLLNDFRFTGWGGKFEASRDDQLVQALHEMKLFGKNSLQPYDFALEGGAIEGDGCGTVMTTWNCLHQRHPDLDAQHLTAKLASMLHAKRVLILQHGELQGDDTDAHIDTLARFAAADAIVFQACDDPADAHFEPLAKMRVEIEALRTLDQQRYRLFPLPWAKPIHAQSGRRLAASYANFLIINGAVLMPAYGDPADIDAEKVLSLAFPDRQIIAVPCRALIEQNGSLHCVTMQLPAGVLHV